MRLPVLSLAAALVALTACDASIETADGVKTSDPLYAEVKQLCSADAVVLRVEDLEDDECLCCLSYGNFVPSVHCMTASGATVTNPQDSNEISATSKAAKLSSKAKK